MTVKFLQRSIWQRIFGISATDKPQDESGWHYESGQLTISLDRIPELTRSGTAVRFEGKSLPVRVLVVFGEDGQYQAFHNRCTHLGHRRLDYVPGTETVQCCSVNKSTFTFEGDKIHGPAPQSIRTYPVEVTDGELRIKIS
jgi:nitrite reductase/ring-hydroxylating ferredoxin subunit